MRSITVPRGHLFRGLRTISAHRKVLALTVSLFPLEKCMFVSCFAFVEQRVLPLCPPAEVKAPVEVPAEVCLSEVSSAPRKAKQPEKHDIQKTGHTPRTTNAQTHV